MSQRLIPAIARAAGEVRPPGSKSIANRVLLLAALAEGRSRLRGLPDGEDTVRAMDCLSRLGVGLERDSADLLLTGCGGRFPSRRAELSVGNAGTVTRFLTAALAFAGGHYRLDGVERMRQRPIADLLTALRSLGADIRCPLREGYPPLEFAPAVPRGDRVRVRGAVSSQYLSALLMTGPLIAPPGGLLIEIEGELISRPYIAITTGLMAAFGVRVAERPDGFLVPAGGYRARVLLEVEADASAASYPLALGALAGGPVRVLGVGRDSCQGDIRFGAALSRMGARVEYGPDWISAAAPADGRLRGLELNCSDFPDCAMTLVPMCWRCDGPVILSGIGSWRVKECDRLEALATEMSRLGARVSSGPDWIRAEAGEWKAGPDTVTLTYGDHRVAMSMSLAAAAGHPVIIADPGCVAKTYPAFFDDLLGLLCPPS